MTHQAASLWTRMCTALAQPAHLAVITTLLAAGSHTGLAQAQNAADWPSKPLRVVVPFAPGGTSDALARTVALKMADLLKQPVVVENKPGAASTIGIADVARSPADGYTLLLSSPPFVITQYVYPSLPYNARQDFIPLGLLQTTPILLTVNGASKINTPAELFARAKSKPREVSFGTPGNGSLAHLAGEILQQNQGLVFNHIPYKGGSMVLNDLLAGHIDFAFLSPTEVEPYVKNGKLRVIASTGRQRASGFPAVPTLAENGMPTYEVLAWFGFSLRAGTPPAVVARLSESLGQALQNPEVKAKIAQSGDWQNGAVEPFATLLESEHERWSGAVKSAHIKPD